MVKQRTTWPCYRGFPIDDQTGPAARPPSRGFMLASLHVGRKVQFAKRTRGNIWDIMGINLYHQIARNKFCANLCFHECIYIYIIIFIT